MLLFTKRTENKERGCTLRVKTLRAACSERAEHWQEEVTEQEATVAPQNRRIHGDLHLLSDETN